MTLISSLTLTLTSIYVHCCTGPRFHWHLHPLMRTLPRLHCNWLWRFRLNELFSTMVTSKCISLHHTIALMTKCTIFTQVHFSESPCIGKYSFFYFTILRSCTISHPSEAQLQHCIILRTLRRASQWTTLHPSELQWTILHHIENMHHCHQSASQWTTMEWIAAQYWADAVAALPSFIYALFA